MMAVVDGRSFSAHRGLVDKHMIISKSQSINALYEVHAYF